MIVRQGSVVEVDGLNVRTTKLMHKLESSSTDVPLRLWAPYAMSGVWKFGPTGVLSLVENPLAGNSDPGPSSGRKVLVHSASNEAISNYEQLDAKLRELGWWPYFSSQYMRQYHRSNNTSDLITLPSLFCGLRTTHMYDIVVKTRSAFQVRDA